MEKSKRIIQNQAVRDLAWLFSSPEILTFSNSLQRSPLSADWLLDLDRNPIKLMSHLADKNTKMLGPYFEALWEFYLLNYPKVTLIAKNVQVNDDSKTIGEFDFLYQDTASQKIVHLEVAVKYYLGCFNANDSLDSSRLSSWLGPGTRDRLDLKALKLAEQQSKLSETSAGKKVLASLGIERVESKIALLGYLFYPDEKMHPTPQNSHPSHLKGRWMHLSKLDACFSDKSSSEFAIIPKPHWLSPVTKPERCLTISALKKALTARFAKIKHPLMVAEFKKTPDEALSGVNPPVLSKHFHFVVPNDWPEK